MGWTFGFKTKAALVEELLGQRYHLTVQSALVGNNLWCVKQYLKDDELRRYVALFILEAQGGSWGYKDLDESMGLYALDCPLEFLALTTGPEIGYAAEWRAKVRNYHAARA